MKEIIVVGAGHAGLEAAMAVSNMQVKVKLITLNKDLMATLACNPSIGGPAKGIVVREVDALGGVMGRLADLNALQIKMLNTAKGPGVRALRNQIDKVKYSRMVKEVVENQENLELVEAQVKNLIFNDDKVKGVVLAEGTELFADIVILTTGTFLASQIMIGHNVTNIAADDQKTTKEISKDLANKGLDIMRLKTGTVARIKTNSINYDNTEIQPGDEELNFFSWKTKAEDIKLKQLPCYLTYTNLETHQIIEDNLDKSSMYSGVVKGAGARYCPSVEDKIVRFADKKRHQLFIEPESLELDTVYVQGLSTSLPADVQLEMIHSVKGLENAEIVKYGYAIEYDAINPIQLKPSLESMHINNLFFAGQINGTSGYEEAAGQGIMAGINAVLKLRNQEPFILRRDEAYIGVMIDDLVTKGTSEPYRLLTSRSEYRLLLRHDNADQRLTQYGRDLGLVKDDQYAAYRKKLETMAEIEKSLKENTYTGSDEINDLLNKEGFNTLAERISAYDLLKRPRITIENIKPYLDFDYDLEIAKLVEIEIKYAGYIAKAMREAERLRKMEMVKIPDNIDYKEIENLSVEGREKLVLIKPTTLGQASRISGVNPADITVLSFHLNKNNN
ncbi:MAG TPA: tRNA uridine-5-carboxymethylaminomethyl(34) synthesis enzyme MnmG [Erysipelotrichaceae bacterium]|nr:tRNA uridine-5-carboxymethylaminomethyl(34) synthesis enzyme MnmG [Erysipelotrichaceae bacterium]